MSKNSYLSTKYAGVYKIELADGDISYSIGYRNSNNKQVKKVIGKHSEGIRLNYCNAKRIEILSKLKHGEDQPQLTKQKKEKSFFEVAEEYVANKYQKEKMKHKEISNKRDNIKEEKAIVYSKFKSILNKSIIKLTEDDFLACIDTNSAQATKNKQIIYAKSILRFAMLKKYIFNNPLENTKLNKVQNSRERFLSIEEIGILLNTIKNDEQLYLFVLLSLTTGGRTSIMKL